VQKITKNIRLEKTASFEILFIFLLTKLQKNTWLASFYVKPQRQICDSWHLGGMASYLNFH